MEMTNDSTWREVIAFAKARKKIWIIPLILLLASLGTILVIVEGSALSPFLYAIF